MLNAAPTPSSPWHGAWVVQCGYEITIVIIIKIIIILLHVSWIGRCLDALQQWLVLGLIPLCPATQVAQAGASIPRLAHTPGCALVCYLGIVDTMYMNNMHPSLPPRLMLKCAWGEQIHNPHLKHHHRLADECFVSTFVLLLSTKSSSSPPPPHHHADDCLGSGVITAREFDRERKAVLLETGSSCSSTSTSSTSTSTSTSSGWSTGT